MNNKDKLDKNDKKLISDSNNSSNLQIEMNITTTKSNKSNKSKPILVIEDDDKIQNEVIINPQIEVNKIHNEDCITGMKKIASESVDIVICDPPYNIGKDFGNDSDKQKIDEYLLW